eukprot:c11231_g1_i1.p1 GENE.c11231_g1_i1~~c11231_g1_i1.p1  ORF type:complete len:629 (+),score=93.32 c11231_g1_i1:117-2003(+)
MAAASIASTASATVPNDVSCYAALNDYFMSPLRAQTVIRSFAPDSLSKPLVFQVTIHYIDAAANQSEVTLFFGSSHFSLFLSASAKMWLGLSLGFLDARPHRVNLLIDSTVATVPFDDSACRPHLLDFSLRGGALAPLPLYILNALPLLSGAYAVADAVPLTVVCRGRGTDCMTAANDCEARYPLTGLFLAGYLTIVIVAGFGAFLIAAISPYWAQGVIAAATFGSEEPGQQWTNNVNRKLWLGAFQAVAMLAPYVMCLATMFDSDAYNVGVLTVALVGLFCQWVLFVFQFFLNQEIFKECEKKSRTPRNCLLAFAILMCLLPLLLWLPLLVLGLTLSNSVYGSLRIAYIVYSSALATQVLGNFHFYVLRRKELAARFGYEAWLAERNLPVSHYDLDMFGRFDKRDPEAGNQMWGPERFSRSLAAMWAFAWIGQKDESLREYRLFGAPRAVPAQYVKVKPVTKSKSSDDTMEDLVEEGERVATVNVMSDAAQKEFYRNFTDSTAATWYENTKALPETTSHEAEDFYKRGRALFWVRLIVTVGALFFELVASYLLFALLRTSDLLLFSSSLQIQIVAVVVVAARLRVIVSSNDDFDLAKEVKQRFFDQRHYEQLARNALLYLVKQERSS